MPHDDRIRSARSGGPRKRRRRHQSREVTRTYGEDEAAIVALIAGVLAAIVPARRAAKLNVLRALQYE